MNSSVNNFQKKSIQLLLQRTNFTLSNNDRISQYNKNQLFDQDNKFMCLQLHINFSFKIHINIQAPNYSNLQFLEIGLQNFSFQSLSIFNAVKLETIIIHKNNSQSMKSMKKWNYPCLRRLDIKESQIKEIKEISRLIIKVKVINFLFNTKQYRANPKPNQIQQINFIIKMQRFKPHMQMQAMIGCYSIDKSDICIAQKKVYKSMVRGYKQIQPSTNQNL